jgi:hypothetical protein
MAERAVRIGRPTIEAAAAEAGVYRLWDSALKGFGLKVSKHAPARAAPRSDESTLSPVTAR